MPAPFFIEQSTESASSQVLPSGPVLAYECLWRGCDYQYEDLQELKIHLLDSTCHLRKSGTVFSIFNHFLFFRLISLPDITINLAEGR